MAKVLRLRDADRKTMLLWLKELLHEAGRAQTYGTEELLARTLALRLLCDRCGVCTHDILDPGFFSTTNRSVKIPPPPQVKRRGRSSNAHLISNTPS